MEFSTLVVARNAFSGLSLACASYVLLIVVWPRLIPETVHPAPRPTSWSRAVAVIVVAAAVFNAALLSLAWDIGASLVRMHRIVMVPKPVRAVAPAAVDEPRSLVMVVAESLEATYARADIFGADLTPGLSALSSTGGLTFTDIRQVSHTGWTTGALVAASCTEPMAPGDYWEQMTSRADARMPGAICLGDVLAAAGYRTVFMVGHPLEFAGVDGFGAAHGFAEMLGLRALAPTLQDPAYRSGWGCPTTRC